MVGIIGDIHGCLYTLKALIEKIKNKYPGINLYSVGDLVDRGKFSCEVIDLIISEKISFTPGNHDYMFLYYIENRSGSISRAWIYNGYESTMASYSGRPDKMKEHLSLISKAPLYFNLEDCFISHAGISYYYKPYLPEDYKNNLSVLDKLIEKDIESEQGILWTREELLDIGKLQVVGHTRREEVSFSSYNNVLYIDTSVYAGNKLSAAIIENNKVLEIISVSTNPGDLYW